MWGGEGRCGDLDHDPDLRGSRPGLRGHLADRREPLLELLERRHHREHDPDRVIGGDAHERAQLSEQDLGPRRRQPEPSHAEERVRLGSQLEVGDRLVGARVERPHRERTTVECDGRSSIRLLLFGFARHRVAPEEQELAPEQAHAVTPRGECGRDVGGAADVGHDRNVPSVLHHGGLARASPCRAFAVELLRSLGLQVGDRGPGGVDVNDPSPSVEPDRDLLVELGDPVAETDHGRDPQRAGQHRRVRGRTAMRHGDAETGGGVQRDRVGRFEVADRQDPGGGEPAVRRLDAEEFREDLPPDAPEIAGSLPQVGIVQLVPDGRQLRDGISPRCRRAAIRDAVPRRAEERLILQEEQVSLEDRRLARADAHDRGLPLVGDVGANRGDRRVQTRALLLRRAGGPIRDGELGNVEMTHGSDGYPGGGRDADDRSLDGRGALGWRRFGDRQVLRGLVEAAIRERPDGIDRERRLRPPGDDLDPLPDRDPERGDRVEAARAHGTSAGRDVRHADVGIEGAGGLHQPRGRTGMEPVGEVDHDREPHLGPGGLLGQRAGLVRCSRTRAEVRFLARQSAERFLGHVVQRAAELRGDGGRNRAFDERRARESHLPATIRIEELERHLRGQDRAPQIHQHEDAVLRPRLLQRSDDPGCVGPDRVFLARRLQAAGRRDRQVRTSHLTRERRDALGHLVAVRDQDESDHGSQILRPGTRASRSGSIRTRASPVRARRAHGRSIDADAVRDRGRAGRSGGPASRGP